LLCGQQEMNIEQCIKNANEAHSSGNSDEAMRWLKKAGSLGDLNAALDYAYFKSGERVLVKLLRRYLHLATKVLLRLT